MRPVLELLNLTEKEKTRIKPYLKDFKGISVREESSKELIKDIVDVSVQVFVILCFYYLEKCGFRKEI